MVRKEIYQRIVEQLRTALGGEIKHIDLWNHNVEFIEQEQQWSRPAVFVEFGAINWQRLGGQPNAMRGEGTVSLHIVTDWVGSTTLGEDTDDFAAFELSERICSVVRGLHPGAGGSSTASRSTAWWELAPSRRARTRAQSPSAIRSAAPRSMPARRRASHGDAATS